MVFQWFDVLVLTMKVSGAVLCTLQKQVVSLLYNSNMCLHLRFLPFIPLTR